MPYHEHFPRRGRIEVVCGSMFSGKTEELIRRIKRARIAQQQVKIFKPCIDTRYSDVEVVSSLADVNRVLGTDLLYTDIVDVFRRSEFLPDVARDFLQADAQIFWAQLGLENKEAEEILRAGGCEDIVMNRCIKKEHTRLILEQ